MVWAVSEAPNIFTSRHQRVGIEDLRAEARNLVVQHRMSCNSMAAFRLKKQASGPREKVGLGWAGLGLGDSDSAVCVVVWLSQAGGEMLHRLLVDADVYCAVASHSILSYGHGSLVTRK